VKVKATPSDFVVREESRLALSALPSTHAIYRLSKTSWDTFDLIDLLARRLGVKTAAIGIGGMKDRHGSTEQMISVRGLATPPRSVADANFTLSFAGWSDGPVSARDVRGNRFEITLRDLAEAEARLIVHNAPVTAREGFPNYFDEQRFGSARHGAGFMGKEMFLGRREKALRLYFTPSKHDDQKTRRMKKCVIENWGKWSACAGLGFGEYGRVLAYLAENHRAYHRALEVIDRRFLLFVLNAYQSFLFNELLARWLRALSAEHRFPLRPVKYAFGAFEYYEELPPGAAPALRATVLPVPGWDTVSDDARVREILSGILAEEGIGLSDLRVRQMSRIRVGGVPRAAVVVPEDLVVEPPAPDDLYPGKQKALLRFFLPRGSYATLLIKRLTLPRPRAAAESPRGPAPPGP
jgi:tRNA pseudouridine13 synthase